nr:hypothetical protein [Paenibacillus turpanensis]
MELRFDRRHIQQFIKSLIQEGYSLYWNESDQHFTISIRSGRRLVKLRFQRIGDRFKMIGDYSIRDEKLSEVMERMIGDTRGHAVVKRFRDRQIVIENIMFGELIRMVEVSGVEQKVLFQKELVVTPDEMVKAFKSNRAEERIPLVRLELDYELAVLHEAIENGNEEQKAKSLAKLAELRQEMLLLEM